MVSLSTLHNFYTFAPQFRQWNLPLTAPWGADDTYTNSTYGIFIIDQTNKKKKMKENTPEMKYTECAIACGLDFGTSNSVISLTDFQSGKELFTYAASSILYFPEGSVDTCYVGKEAQDRYVKDDMTGRLLKSVKTLLRQDDFLFTWIAGRKVTPDQLVTYIIRHLKEKAEEFIGIPLTNVTLGRPAIFSKDTKKENVAVKRLLLAAQNAGFTNIRLQLEPIAAAFAYEQTLSKAENILVADFGGGTSDFTIVRLAPDKIGRQHREDDIIAHGGLYIGGDLFDSEIMWHKVTPHLGRGVLYQSYDKEIEIPNNLYRELRNWERSFLLKDSKSRRAMDKYYVFSGNNPRIENVRTLIDNNYVYYLFKKIEQAKIDLSTLSETNIHFSKLPQHIDEPFHIEEFGNIINKHIIELKQYLLDLLLQSGYDTSQIDSVFLTGGSSLALPVKNILAEIFGKDKLCQGDTFHSVAYGLSLSHS